jgi:hypothetical protein
VPEKFGANLCRVHYMTTGLCIRKGAGLLFDPGFMVFTYDHTAGDYTERGCLRLAGKTITHSPMGFIPYDRTGSNVCAVTVMLRFICDRYDLERAVSH